MITKTPRLALSALMSALPLLALAACAEPIPEQSRADEIPLAEVKDGDADVTGVAGTTIDEGRTDPLLSVVTRADGALLGNANVATCSFTSDSDRMLFQTAVPDDGGANPRGVARVSGEPVLFTAEFTGAQARMEEGGRYGSDGDLVAQIVRGEAEDGEQSQPDAAEDGEGDAPARIETRTWPATLTIAYEGTPLSTRSSGTWACGN
tara:strand:- start:550 stop:1170 length:621 start_codon:yes stop_codon:yes gene_type:complete